MNLELYDKDNKLICKLDDDDKTLWFYNIEDGMRIHVSYFSLFHQSYISFAYII